jgi:hypothetical protein
MLGFSTEVVNFRNGISIAGGTWHNENVSVEYRVLDDVPVRVYTPKASKSNAMPLMVFYHG